jgi:ArsR family metal-binding transcriptional regulator
VIVFGYDGHEISLFKKGRMLIKNVQDEDEAVKIFQVIMQMIDAG